jgi:hypothetical protein
MKSGNLNFLEPSGPLLACNGTALTFNIIIFISWVSSTFLWKWPETPHFCHCPSTVSLMTEVYLHYLLYFERSWSVPRYLYSLPILRIHRCYCRPRSLSSPFFTWPSHLHFILYAKVPKFLCSVTLLAVSIFLNAISVLICGHFIDICENNKYNKRVYRGVGIMCRGV